MLFVVRKGKIYGIIHHLDRCVMYLKERICENNLIFKTKECIQV